MTTSLTREAQAARQLIDSLKDIIGDDEDFAMDVIEGQTNFSEVVNMLVGQDSVDKALAAGIGAHVKEMTARKARIEERRERRRQALTVAFQRAGIKGALRCPLGTVGLNNTPAKAIPTDEKLIPDEFWTQPEPEFDRRALTAALKAGRDIHGATLSNGGVTISIRTT